MFQREGTLYYLDKGHSTLVERFYHLGIGPLILWESDRLSSWNRATYPLGIGPLILLESDHLSSWNRTTYPLGIGHLILWESDHLFSGNRDILWETGHGKRNTVNFFCGFPKLSTTIVRLGRNQVTRVVCPNFGHPSITSSFSKYTFLQVKNSFATIVNER